MTKYSNGKFIKHENLFLEVLEEWEVKDFIWWKPSWQWGFCRGQGGTGCCHVAKQSKLTNLDLFSSSYRATKSVMGMLPSWLPLILITSKHHKLISLEIKFQLEFGRDKHCRVVLKASGCPSLPHKHCTPTPLLGSFFGSHWTFWRLLWLPECRFVMLRTWRRLRLAGHPLTLKETASRWQLAKHSGFFMKEARIFVQILYVTYHRSKNGEEIFVL